MRQLALVSCFAVLTVACTKKDEGTTPQPQPQPCNAGERRCNGNDLERCIDDAWKLQRTCLLSCDGASTPPTCIDRTGHEAGSVKAGADVRLAPDYQFLDSFDAVAQDEVLFENYVGYGAALTPGTSATITLDHTEASFATCGICVRAFTADRQFMARTGTIEVTSLAANPGEQTAITLTNVVLREVTISSTDFRTTDVPNGQIWVIDSLTLSATADPFGCDVVDPALVGGETLCTDTDLVYTCNDSNTADEVAGSLDFTTDCAATGDVCVQDGTSAACREPCTVPGEQRCNGFLIESCSAGVWTTATDCGAQICFDDAGTFGCYDACTVGEAGTHRCGGNFVQTCAEVWKNAQDCALTGQICDIGTSACVVEPCTTVDAKRCVGNLLQTCNGTSWQSQDCGAFYTCDAAAGTCGASSCAATDLDVERCAGDVQQRCDGASWLDLTGCAVGKLCRVSGTTTYCTDSCTAGETGIERCGSPWVERCDGTAYKRVTDCAAQSPAAVCVAAAPNAYCYEACSTADELRCAAGDVLQRCNGTYWAFDTSCYLLGQVCASTPGPAACADEACVSGTDTTRCLGDWKQTCTGNAWTGSNCATTNESCVYDGSNQAVCSAGSCTAGEASQTRCVGADVQLCDGTYWHFQQTCANGCNASSGACNP